MQCLFAWRDLRYFLIPDQDTHTGQRVAFSASAMPTTRWGHSVNPTRWNEADGFSTIAPLLFVFDQPVDAKASRFVNHTNIEAYAAADATTVLVNLDTGKRVPHWVEIDAFNIDYGDGAQYTNEEGKAVKLQPLIILQPAVPLMHSTRYAAAVRGFVDTSGQPIVPSPAFAAIRDGSDTSSRAQYFHNDIFPAIAGAGGGPTSDLQLAWDFTTVSSDNSLGRALSIRDQALAAVGTKGPEPVIDKVDVAMESAAECAAAPAQNKSQVARWVWGHFDAPQ